MQSFTFRRLIDAAYRLACVSALIALAVLSLLPADSIHRSEVVGGHGEHLIAYAGTAFVFSIGCRERVWPPLLVALVAYAALMETLQLFVPGRTSQVSDFLYSAVGILVGFLIAKALQAQFTSGSKTR